MTRGIWEWTWGGCWRDVQYIWVATPWLELDVGWWFHFEQRPWKTNMFRRTSFFQCQSWQCHVHRFLHRFFWCVIPKSVGELPVMSFSSTRSMRWPAFPFFRNHQSGLWFSWRSVSTFPGDCRGRLRWLSHLCRGRLEIKNRRRRWIVSAATMIWMGV